jgi:nucleotide-binding universal stress UspA family protein
MATEAHGSGHPAGRRIVVGVDGSLNSRVALEHAARRAGPGGHLVVANAMSVLPETVNRAIAGLNDVHRDIAGQLAEQESALAGIEATPEVRDGRPAEVLAELARETDADEIVVGTRGLGRFAAALGSVAHALLGQADRPVVVVPRAAADHPRDGHAPGQCVVIVGYDGSPPAREALAYAARRSCRGGRVVAVHAFHPPPDWLGSPYYQQALDAHQTRGRELLQALEEQGNPGVERTTSLLEGPPARAIVAAADARDADEIVIGSRGFGRVRGVLGSVSHAVLHEADRPVVVIPADAAAARAPDG